MSAASENGADKEKEKGNEKETEEKKQENKENKEGDKEKHDGIDSLFASRRQYYFSVHSGERHMWCQCVCVLFVPISLLRHVMCDFRLCDGIILCIFCHFHTTSR